MNGFLLLIQSFLAFVKSYCFLPLLIIMFGYAVIYCKRILNAAWADVRNSGTDVVETFRLAKRISLERLSRRELPTMIYVVGMPLIIVLLLLSVIY